MKESSVEGGCRACVGCYVLSGAERPGIDVKRKKTETAVKVASSKVPGELAGKISLCYSDHIYIYIYINIVAATWRVINYLCFGYPNAFFLLIPKLGIYFSYIPGINLRRRSVAIRDFL